MLPSSKKTIRITSVLCMLLAVVTVAFGLSSTGCVAPAPSAASTKQEIASVYTVKIQPLKTQQCGRCHYSFYDQLRNEGGKHRIDCQRCHEQFHVYRPGRVKYEDILPKCETCHGQIHGAGLAGCAECHEAHAPMNLPANRALEQGCYICHPEADKEMKTYVTQHTELYCFTCHHTRHRHVPECMECHQPHTRRMTQADCLACHPPHKALQVIYPENIPQESCAGCHRHAYDKLKKSGTKHTALGCARCHPEHRAIMQCQDCHPETHGADMLQKYPVCGRCHGIAHSLSS